VKYDLQRRALEMGWSKELIQVINDDQGQSGADAQQAGFQCAALAKLPG